MRLNRVEAPIMLANRQSQRVLEKLGMKFEGISRQSLEKLTKKIEETNSGGKVYLELYRGWHPIPFPGDKQYEDKIWKSIRH